MQGYLKLKETDEELYEVKLSGKLCERKLAEKEINISDFNIKKAKYNIWSSMIYFLIQLYLGLVVKIKKWFNIITVKEIYSGLIFILPISQAQCRNIYQKQKLKKCIPKLKRLMNRYQITRLVLSEELQDDETFLREFQKKQSIEKQIHILDGRELMPYLIKEIVEYISKKQGKTIELEDLYLLIKQDKEQYKENISFLAQYFKTINIITPCLKTYQNLANYLEEKYNTMITVTNNKKKSLRKAKWIINFDLSAEEMKKYTIYRTSIIIYLEKDEIYQNSSFGGLHICNAGIDVSQEIKEYFTKENLINQNSITVLYESMISNRRGFFKTKEQMEKDKVRIEKLYGNRGILSDVELKSN